VADQLFNSVALEIAPERSYVLGSTEFIEDRCAEYVVVVAEGVSRNVAFDLEIIFSDLAELVRTEKFGGNHHLLPGDVFAKGGVVIRAALFRVLAESEKDVLGQVDGIDGKGTVDDEDHCVALFFGGNWLEGRLFGEITFEVASEFEPSDHASGDGCVAELTTDCAQDEGVAMGVRLAVSSCTVEGIVAKEVVRFLLNF